MKVLTLLVILMAFSSIDFAASSEWVRKDLYEEGKKSAEGGDYFLAIGQLYAFKEFNKSLLDEQIDIRNAIDSATDKCRTKILSERKVEYVFLPTEKKCDSDKEGASGTGLVTSIGSGFTDIPKVRYRIVKKKGNPQGMEAPEYDIMFDIETKRSTVSYPLVPSFYTDGEFKPYGLKVPEVEAKFTAGAEVEYGSVLLKEYMQSKGHDLEAYMLDPSTLYEKMRALEGTKLELTPGAALEGQ